MIKWLQSFLNEPGTNEGSSQRLMLVLLVVTILVLVVYLTVTGPGHKLPEVPATLQNMVQYLGSILVAGMAFGKGASAYRAKHAAKQTVNQTAKQEGEQ